MWRRLANESEHTVEERMNSEILRCAGTVYVHEPFTLDAGSKDTRGH